MRVHLIRHAVAEPGRSGQSDSARALTPDGRRKFAKASRGLERLGVRFDRVYHSPKRRAAETADVLARLVDGESVETEGLARPPGATLLSEIHGDSVALVGHEPMLSSLAAWLVMGVRDRGAKLPVKKGGVIVLEGELRPGGMRLVLSLTPKALRRIARR